MNPLITGKSTLQNVVSVEAHDGYLHVYMEQDGEVLEHFLPNKYWIVANASQCPGKGWVKMKGNLYYNWGKQYLSKQEWQRDRSYRYDCFSIANAKEASLVNKGITYFKGLRFEDVSILAFDIETVGLVMDHTSKVFLIANTLRKNGVVTRKLFSADEYPNQAELLEAWCAWVREVNPSIMCGHNIFCYDLPYLHQVAKNFNASLQLGRDKSLLRFDKWESKFRKDASMFYHYNKAHVYGREMVDTMFLSIKHDIGRKYESYGLKAIIAAEGLEVPGRVFYEAMKIKDNWHDPIERVKIKQYAEFDSDDALSLYDLMAPPYFYLNRSVPKPYQLLMESATGSQLNSILIRSYLQEGHSIPKASPVDEYQGGLSSGTPGIYKNVFKLDIQSEYPSIILHYKLFDPLKDPKGNFLKMVEVFTEERFRNKKLAKETGDPVYEYLQQAQKLVINSSYGLCGAPGLNFNSPKIASFITKKGRECLKRAIYWATGKELCLEPQKKIEEEMSV